jgi:hypothetical protein
MEKPQTGFQAEQPARQPEITARPLTPMLPLDSPRWVTLSTFFGSPRELPDYLQRWQNGLGTPEEQDVYRRFQDYFLHQATITDVAYAVAPYLALALDEKRTTRAFDYVLDLGLIEANRLTPPSPPVPEDLQESYSWAVSRARVHAADLLGVEWPKTEFQYLLSTIAWLHGHSGLGWALWHLGEIVAECPKCGEVFCPEEFKDPEDRSLTR